MRAHGGIGLGGIVIVGALLYYTGAGSWLWKGVSGLEKGCYTMLSDIGTTIGTPVCVGIGRGIDALENVGDSIQERIDRARGRVASDVPDVNDFGQAMHARIAEFTSSSDTLSHMMESGPRMQIGSNLRERFQKGIDSFAIGQDYLNKGSASEAVPWLNQGAAQPEGYGMLSQLSLGNLYSTGSGDVPADPSQAKQRYQQAKDSINQLMASDTPQAHQMLQSLPESPEVMRQKLDDAMAQLGKSMRSK